MIGWIVVAFALTAFILNIHKKRICFAFWFTGNCFWIYDLMSQNPPGYSYVALALLYNAFNIYGWILWTRDAKKRQSIS